MNASERLKVAGQAAETLETMGFVAVALMAVVRRQRHA